MNGGAACRVALDNSPDGLAAHSINEMTQLGQAIQKDPSPQEGIVLALRSNGR